MSDWIDGMFQASPLWVGVAVAICVTATIAYLLWTTLKSRRS